MAGMIATAQKAYKTGDIDPATGRPILNAKYIDQETANMSQAREMEKQRLADRDMTADQSSLEEGQIWGGDNAEWADDFGWHFGGIGKIKDLGDGQYEVTGNTPGKDKYGMSTVKYKRDGEFLVPVDSGEDWQRTSGKEDMMDVAKFVAAAFGAYALAAGVGGAIGGGAGSASAGGADIVGSDWAAGGLNAGSGNVFTPGLASAAPAASSAGSGTGLIGALQSASKIPGVSTLVSKALAGSPDQGGAPAPAPSPAPQEKKDVAIGSGRLQKGSGQASLTRNDGTRVFGSAGITFG